ncbi:MULTISPECIES: SMODS domain-containing nucleotidyltransferase [Bacillus cereus group]|uniref:SMODS domain-containing nucleotidyltransferase n=1 Tax=Bacillus cereus group TaxID=86661 RepID=UPI000C292E69|nr:MULTISPECIES: nucleotidyltransferase [Bacillus cereus group]AZR75817.1 nucleotidyltransferase [Bacillus thuringiensis]MBG9521720.1 nucleotidyltransferase [Bacillus thuringiensis]MCU5040554.1 nucleotidyltransferase [Bacillus cereus]
MSVQSHLESLASKLNLKQDEKDKVKKSIDTLSDRLDRYFNGELKEHFQFGSYTRGTILPRKADEYSDIDYMIIFINPNDYKPQTLLNYLKKFAEYYYHSSEIYRSHPTIVLELNHIKFELVPSKKDYWGNIYIPSPSSSYEEWMKTDPNDFNKKLTDANVKYSYEIKPLVRLMKYWNRLNGSYLSSYELENWITENYYLNCSNLKDFIYSTFEKLNYNYSSPQYYKDKVDRAKKIIAKTKEYEADGMPYSAQEEIKKLFPDF